MKISDLIGQLEKIKAASGDLTVVQWVSADDDWDEYPGSYEIEPEEVSIMYRSPKGELTKRAVRENSSLVLVLE